MPADKLSVAPRKVANRLPSMLLRNPTVFDVLWDRVQADEQIRPEAKQAVFVQSCQIIRERGIRQI